MTVTCITIFWFTYFDFRVMFAIGNASKAIKTYGESLDLTLANLRISGVVKTAIKNSLNGFKSKNSLLGNTLFFGKNFSHF